MENPIKMDDLGGISQFSETSMSEFSSPFWSRVVEPTEPFLALIFPRLQAMGGPQHLTNHWNFRPSWQSSFNSTEVGILMLIYWDICTEAVNLVYALDPKQSPGEFRVPGGLQTLSTKNAPKLGGFLDEVPVGWWNDRAAHGDKSHGVQAIWKGVGNNPIGWIKHVY